MGTLLGPEETGPFAWPLLVVVVVVGLVFLQGWSPAIPAGVLACGFACCGWACGGGSGVWWWGGLVVWLLFVNCIVDASIFVAKLVRAHGGCLGIRSR